MTDIPLGLCGCGCGDQTNVDPKTKKPRRFLKDHASKFRTLPDGRIVCRRCDKPKHRDEFVISGGRIRGCKECYAGKQRGYYQQRREHYARVAKNRALKRKYGITIEDYERLLKSQQHRCAICRTKLGDKARVDHCHRTGKVRGIICHNCNYALGGFKDSRKILENAVQYLKR